MKILFVAPGDILKARVEPLMWVRMCEAFANNSVDTRLVSLNVKRPGNVAKKELWSYYGIREAQLKSTIMPTLLSHRSSDQLTNVWGVVLHSIYAVHLLIFRRIYDCVLTKKYSFLIPYIFLRRWIGNPRIVLEIHALPTNPKTFGIIRAVDGIVTNSETLKKDLVQLLGIPASMVLVSYLAPHSTSEVCEISRSTALRRTRLQRLENKSIVVYAGKLLENEIEIILNAAAMVSEAVHFVILGGNPDALRLCDQKVREKQLGNVTFPGFVAPSKVGEYLQLSNILLVNYDVRESGSHKYMTPGKIFDYMLTGKPMVSAHFEALEEILEDEVNSFFFEPGNPKSLADCIGRVLDNPEQAARVSAQAKKESEKFTWSARAEEISMFVRSLSQAGGS